MPAFLAEATQPAHDVLSGIAAILSAVAWPALILTLLIWFRKPLGSLLRAAVSIAETAEKVKIWQIEFDRAVKQQLDTAASTAEKAPIDAAAAISSASAPAAATELKAASKVNRLVADAPTTTVRETMLDSIRERMVGLASEYDATRAGMPSGAFRTRAMNVIAAQMRTLGIAAVPFVDEFSKNPSSAGMRLAAICILQMAPDMRFVPWLCDTMHLEQPFVFYQSSLALLNAVRKFGRSHRSALQKPIEDALERLKAFSGTPDAGTIETLDTALKELETMNR